MKLRDWEMDILKANDLFVNRCSVRETIEAQQQEIKKLTQRGNYQESRANKADYKIEQLTAQVTRLREALAPFAEFWDYELSNVAGMNETQTIDYFEGPASIYHNAHKALSNVPIDC